MHECKQLIAESVRAYQNLLIHAQDFANLVNQGAMQQQQINEYTVKLRQLQSIAEDADRKLFQRLESKTDILITEGLLQEQQRLMVELQQVNNFLLPRVANLMEMTRSEIVRLRKGVSVIAGYHSKTPAAESSLKTHT